MLGTHKSVVATADNAPSSLRSGRLFSAVPHFKRSPNQQRHSLSTKPIYPDTQIWEHGA